MISGDYYRGRGKLGLFRAASFTDKDLAEVYREINPRFTQNSEITDALFGGVSDSLGFDSSQQRIPTHDELGRFPIAIDQRGREYFDGSLFDFIPGEDEDGRNIEPSFQKADLFVRVPRSLTRAVQTNLSSTVSDVIDLPQEGEKLELWLPFYKDSSAQVRRHIPSKPDLQKFKDEWIKTDLIQQQQPESKSFVLRAIVRSVIPRESLAVTSRAAATGIVTLDIPDETDKYNLQLALVYDQSERNLLSSIILSVVNSETTSESDKIEFIQSQKKKNKAAA